MMDKTTPPIVLITGAARRIGASIARECHAKHMNIIVHYQTSEKEALQLCHELNQIRDNSAYPLKADLTCLEGMSNLIAEAISLWGYLDVLVNNAARFYATSVKDVTEGQWNDLMNSNLQAPYFLAKQCYHLLAIRSGCIVNIADIHGSKPLKNHSVYSISKAGMIMMTKSLAREFAPNVRVNAVSPGAIMWPEHENELSSPQKDSILQKNLLKRQGSAENIAEAVLFFIRNQYVTGQILAVDGGRT